MAPTPQAKLLHLQEERPLCSTRREPAAAWKRSSAPAGSRAESCEKWRQTSGGGATWGTQDPGLQHIGLGAQGGDVTVTVRWPDGRTSQHTLAVDRAWRIPRDAAPAALP